MREHFKTKAAILLTFLISFLTMGQTINLFPPSAEKIKKELTIHGHTRIDNYYWLNERENSKVIDYLISENSYLEAMMEHKKEFREKLFQEIVGRIKKDDSSVPYKDNGYYYYSRYEEGKEYPIYCRKKAVLTADEEIMLNVNDLAIGYNYYAVAGLSVSPDNKMLAYGVDTLSRRIYTIYFKNLETGELDETSVPNTTGSTVWANDNRTIFYTVKDQTLRPFKIFKHVLFSGFEDVEVYVENDPIFHTYVYKSKSRQYIMIASNSTLTNEYRYLNADNPDGEFKIIQQRARGHEYAVDHYLDRFFIVTNLNAKNFRLMETPADKTSKENWKEIIPHRSDVLLEGIEIFKKYLVVKERKNGLSNLRVINWKDNSEHYLNFGEAAYAAYISINPEFDTDLLRYSYTSLTTPNSTYDYNMESREKILLKQEEILGGFNKDNYQTERIYAEALDGSKVPISLVYKKGINLDGRNPLLLYGYGSYGINMEASFSSVRLSLIDRGFIYAIAHIRGGQEMGREWYDNGKLLKKKNTFTDFISCAEYLIDRNYTSKEKIFALGGSAGGLLIGAVINMRPDLFKGVVASVPFVDVITTMLDESIPLTTGEFDEWGNPKNKEYYDYILSYSPYDQVESKDYPHILILTGLHDSQVQYWEPAKWAAKLRELKTDNNNLFLFTNMDAGHGGASGRFRKLRDTALIYTFLLRLAGTII
jgi:oligopeptidase B